MPQKYGLASGSLAGRQMQDEFSPQLLELLLHREKRLLPSSRLPQGEGVMGWRERNREAQWLCNAARRLGLGADSATLAVAIFDRVVSKTRVPTKYVNCVATASLSLARKICEDHDEDASVFLGRLRLEYSAGELKRMEMRILGVLEWDAYLPCVSRFAELQLLHLGAAFFLPAIRSHLEAVICDSTLAFHFRPSLLALSVVALVVEASNRHAAAAVAALAKICKIDLSELSRCRSRVSCLWSRLLLPAPSAFDMLSSSDDTSSCDVVGLTPPAASPSSSTPDLASPRALQPTPC